MSANPQESLHSRRSSQASDASSTSNTSTVKFSQEPFDQYQHRVSELCREIWPPKSNALSRLLKLRVFSHLRSNRVLRSKLQISDPYNIERLKGGSYNRIIGVTPASAKDQPRTPMILRIPRFVNAQTKREVATLQYIYAYSSIPVAPILKYDLTASNPLKNPFVLQTRVAGHDLQSAAQEYPTLTQAQKCTIARDLAKIYLQMQNLSSPVPGWIDLGPDSSKEAQKFSVHQFNATFNAVPSPDRDDKFERGPAPSYDSVSSFLINQYARWKTDALPYNILKADYMDRLTRAAWEMDKLDFLGPNEYTLNHPDLSGGPRNIMVYISPTDGSAKISGIIDWDGAAFLPRFASLAPPMWLWNWDKDMERDLDDGDWEEGADEVPGTEGEREIKKLFEEGVGEEGLRVMYGMSWRLARKLVDFAVKGLHSSWGFDDCERVLGVWAECRDSEVRRLRAERDQEEEEESEEEESDDEDVENGNGKEVVEGEEDEGKEVVEGDTHAVDGDDHGEKEEQAEDSDEDEFHETMEEHDQKDRD